MTLIRQSPSSDQSEGSSKGQINTQYANHQLIVSSEIEKNLVLVLTLALALALLLFALVLDFPVQLRSQTNHS
ncbi:uncharacterized protein EAF02_008375 [Botrytis sinoallii]|uniref:uncharacterized protein n=1 Tax=Botrytis sinoallii TaxID=1463999 RepID=UPI0018FF3D4D|nr:uncharacterized protein EAF02_008375 [Botrytis sinoallii]KAF7874398.1 hypothetical protein EAF02_008375 [Botrytis sinoallii]